MTNLSGTGKYFKQPAVAMSFVLLTVGSGKHVRSEKQRVWQEFLKWKEQQVQSGELFSRRDCDEDAIAWQDYSNITKIMTDRMEVIDDDRKSDNQKYTTILSAGFRMDGDDTLMSSEERILVISKEKHYAISGKGEAVYH